MTTTTPARRSLSFATPADLLADLQILQERGYFQLGRWNLAQTCHHLELWMRYPLDGYPRAPLPLRMVMLLLRHTLGPRQLRQVLTTGAFPGGAPTMPATLGQPDLDQPAALDRLRQTLRRLEHHAGPLHPSPLYGPTDHATTLRLHLIHAAHHLSLLVPKT